MVAAAHGSAAAVAAAGCHEQCAFARPLQPQNLGGFFVHSRPHARRVVTRRATLSATGSGGQGGHGDREQQRQGAPTRRSLLLGLGAAVPLLMGLRARNARAETDMIEVGSGRGRGSANLGAWGRSCGG